MKAMKNMKRPRPVVNPYASHAAAEILAGEGKHNDADAIRAEIDPTNEQHGMDPLDFWLAVEELGAAPSD
jgi:hypothetical protein